MFQLKKIKPNNVIFSRHPSAFVKTMADKDRRVCVEALAKSQSGIQRENNELFILKSLKGLFLNVWILNLVWDDGQKRKTVQSLFVVMFGLFILPGCSRKQQKAMIVKSCQRTTQLEESVARMTHVPDVPFGFRLQAVIPDQANPESVQIVYHPVKGVSIDSDVVKKNYEIEMEILGWQLVSTFESMEELFLMFKRPGNVWCQVVLSHENILTVMILQSVV